MIVQTIVGAVLLLHAPCPDDHQALACSQVDTLTPTVWVRPELSRSWRHHAFWHELGHIAAARTPGAVNTETYAERFAVCHEFHGGPDHSVKIKCRRWFR
jgi:hypothetical protein